MVALHYVGLFCHEPPYNGPAQLPYPYGSPDQSDSDISPLLSFYFWEQIYYLDPSDESFPSATKEKLGHFVGIAESVGDAMTYKVLTDDTKMVIYCSSVHSTLVHSECNLCLPRLDGDNSQVPQII